MWQKLLLLALAGALGTLARYGLGALVNRAHMSAFPYGTLAVNVLGCFLAGLLYSLFQHRYPISAEWRMIVFVGFMGAFTTFSAYILETGVLARSAAWAPAFANIALHSGLGFAALYAGTQVAKVV